MVLFEKLSIAAFQKTPYATCSIIGIDIIVEWNQAILRSAIVDNPLQYAASHRAYDKTHWGEAI